MRFPTITLPRILPFLVAVTLLTPAAPTRALAEDPIRRTPGPQADGSVVLPNQWSLRPVGKQVEVEDFPVNIAIHPDGRHAVILHCGFGPHELALLDLETRKVLSRTRVDEAFQGLAFDSTGNRLYASGGAAETILPFRFESGALVPLEALPLRNEKLRGIPAGIAVDSTATTLYAANVWGHSVSRVRLTAADGVSIVDELLLSAEAPAPAPAPGEAAFAALAVSYAALGLVAAVQLARIQRRVPEFGWTTQKVGKRNGGRGVLARRARPDPFQPLPPSLPHRSSTCSTRSCARCAPPYSRPTPRSWRSPPPPRPPRSTAPASSFSRPTRCWSCSGRKSITR